DPVPVLFRCACEQVEALGVGADLGRIEGMAQAIDERTAGGARSRQALVELLRGPALWALRRDQTRVDRRGDGGNGDPEIERSLGRPLARALLARAIADLVDEEPARSAVVRHTDDARSDLDEEGLELALVPGLEDLRDLRRTEPDRVAQEIVGL